MMSGIEIRLEGTGGSFQEFAELEQNDVSLSRHDIRQPLNIVMLACANLRIRIAPHLGPEDAAYLDAKIGRIEEQIARISDMLGSGPDTDRALTERD
jgi:hypothetical protein